MDALDLETLGNKITAEIKNASWFPFKSGHLRNDAVEGRMWKPNVYRIHFDTKIAPYISFLEEGTKPHNILGAFIGKDAAMKQTPPFGTYGRFNGMFHPGSTKHKGFISNKAVSTAIKYIVDNCRGQVA